MRQQQLESTVLWEAFCRPLQLEHDLSVNFHRSHDLFYTISTSRDGRGYSSEERQVLNWLQPHLRQRFAQMLAAEPGHPLGRPAPATPDVRWILCSDDGAVISVEPGVDALLQSVNQRINGRLPMLWRDWLRDQLTPPTGEVIQQPTIEKKGGQSYFI